MIQPGTGTSLKGLKPTVSSTEESKFLYLVVQELQQLRGALYAIFPHTPAAFTVGTTTGAPTNGASTWTITTINVIGKNPTFLLNGVPKVLGVDYSFNSGTGVMTLLSGTFSTGQVWTVLY